MAFQKATKKKCKARVAIYSPSGGGKTYTSLRIATGLGGSIGVIDSEYGSASKYADRFDFVVNELRGNKTIEDYCAAIKDGHGLGVLIIDSMTHAWQELLQEVEKIAQAKYKGNTWSAWSEGTPKQRKLVDAILSFPGHVICTMRSKTEWTQETGTNGRTRPVRVGLAPEQGKSVEYEFDLLMSMTVDHVAHIEKDRSGKFQDQIIDKPGEDFGRALAAWLDQGVDSAPTPSANSSENSGDNSPPATPSVDDLSPEDRSYFEDTLEQLKMADNEGAMKAISMLLQKKSEPLRAIIRPLYAKRLTEIRQGQAA